jgi:PAS domain S-box-containing protein
MEGSILVSLPRRYRLDSKDPVDTRQLRKRAETLIAANPPTSDDISPSEFKRVVHDLQVHQIELEIQNEELRNSRNDLELARDGYAKLYNEAPVGYLSLDRSGIITQANRTFMEWVGDSGRLVGSSFASQLDDPDREAFLGRFGAMFRQPWGKSMDVRMQTPAGQRVMRLLMRRDDKQDRLLLAISDVTEEVKAREALRDAENLWSETFEAMSDAVWILGLDDKVVKCNSASVALLGKTSGAAIHGCFCHELLHGTTRHTEQCPYLRMKQSRQRETSVLWEKGRWLEVSVEPLLSGDGRFIGSVHITKDVTQRKESEDRIQALLKEKQLLLKETHHRIKNNMNVIAALLSLQASRMEEGPGSQALDEARRRVLSMMVVYDKLYRSEDFRSISSADYLSQLLDEIGIQFSREGVKLAHDFEDFMLDSTILFPLGIIMNELITNSFKYAYPDGRTGLITVTLHKEQDTGAVRFCLADDGIDFLPDLSGDVPGGFGLVLVKALAEQLKAEVLVKGTGGTMFCFRFMPESGEKVWA